MLSGVVSGDGEVGGVRGVRGVRGEGWLLPLPLDSGDGARWGVNSGDGARLGVDGKDGKRTVVMEYGGRRTLFMPSSHLISVILTGDVVDTQANGCPVAEGVVHDVTERQALGTRCSFHT